jgi:hypothetical protein
MTIKKILLHVFISATLASLASLVYNSIYSAAFEVNFSMVLNTGAIIGSTCFGTILMGLGYFLCYRWKRERLIGVLNILIVVLSFASIIGVLGFQLPLEVESPELLPGLAIPMHFFPALAFFCIVPFFKYNTTSVS